MRHNTKTIRRWCAATAVIVAALLGACASNEPDVDSGRATQHTDPVPAAEIPRPTTDDSTDTTDGSTDTTDEPTDTTDSTDTTDPIDATDSTDTTDSTDSTDPVSNSTVDSSSGVSGLGDTLFPDLGNPGVDVDHYDIDLAYDHKTNLIEATATLTITPTAELEVFTLDAVDLDVSEVTIDGEPVEFDNDDPELRITPDEPRREGDTFDIAIMYSATGNTGTISAGVTAGWFRTDDGSFVLNEPDGARNWLPSNDHPTDKSTYHFTIHVPDGVTAAANGALIEHTSDADGETWEWNMTDPMTTYLIQLMTGSLTVVEDDGPNGLPLISVLQAGDEQAMQPFIDETAEQIDFFDDFFGPFPFESYGLAMTDGYIGGAMEEAGRSLFSVEDFRDGANVGTALLLSHELTHQWYGDAVTPAEWQDIWLNESFATYGEWMWLEHEGYQTVEDSAAAALGERQHSSYATGTPDIPGLFGFEVYAGGATVLHALRHTVGDDTFFEILRAWVQSNLDTSRTSADFIALSSTIAGQDLTEFFETWLYSVNLPEQYPS